MSTYSPIRDLLLDTVRGKIAGQTLIRRVGINPDIDTGSEEDVWSAGGDIPWYNAGQLLEVVSDDADDTSAGAGLRTVRLDALNGSYASAFETGITMNGTTPVSLSGTFLGDFQFKLLTTGASETNEGTITLRLQGPGATVALIPPGYGQSSAAAYFVPTGKTGYLVGWWASLFGAVSGTEAELRLMIADDGVGWRVSDLMELSADGTSQSSFNAEQTMITLPAKTRIKVRAKVSTNNTGVKAGLAIILV